MLQLRLSGNNTRAMSDATASDAATEDSITFPLPLLDEAAQVEVLNAAKAAGTLSALASTSWELCSRARRQVPCCLRVLNAEQACLMLDLETDGPRSFKGCTHMCLAAADSQERIRAIKVLRKAKRYPGLQHLQLALKLPYQLPILPCIVDNECATFLIWVGALRQLQCLELDVPHLGPWSIRYIQKAPQLTQLQLYMSGISLNAAADLSLMSTLTKLATLTLSGAAAVQPAEPTGPFYLPSSLVRLELQYKDTNSPAPLASWATHLPGCEQLQHLEVGYGPQQHPSTHPAALIPLLARHSRQLRTVSLDMDPGTAWEAAVPGLPVVAAAEGRQWYPSASLAALPMLERLAAANQLFVAEKMDWQHLGKLSLLTQLRQAVFQCTPGLPLGQQAGASWVLQCTPGLAPGQQAGASLAVLELEECGVHLGGYNLGVLLLACPVLARASLTIRAPSMDAAVAPAGTRLPPHPSLVSLALHGCCSWGTAAAAAAEFAALAPDLSGTRRLAVHQWPHSSSASAGAGLPDVSPCTALSAFTLGFSGAVADVYAALAVEDGMMSLISSLQQLQRVEVWDAPIFNVRCVGQLRGQLPRLRHARLVRCGRLLLRSAADREREEEMVGIIQQMLQHLLRLEVTW